MPFSRLLNFQSVSQPLAWWEMALGLDFPALRRFLKPVPGKMGTVYPCPDDSAVRMIIRESGEAYRAVAIEDFANDFEDVVLGWSDVQAYGIDCPAVLEFLREILSVKDRVLSPLKDLHPVGFCPAGDCSVYVSFFGGDDKNLKIAATLPDSMGTGCILFRERVDHVESILKSKGVATVFLQEAFSEDPVNCRQFCRKLQKDITNLELKQHMDSRIDSVGREFADMEAENERLKGDLAKVIAQIASQVDPEYFKWIYMVLASGSVRKAADALDIPSSTFDRQLKDRADSGGSMYKTLFGLISVRRKCGTKSVEGYNPDFALHQQAALSDSSVISDLLGGLRSLNATNWQTVQQELVELVEEEFGTLSGN